MKKKIFSIAIILLVGVMIFTGCGFSALSGGPAKTDAEVSNGKMAITKGNYLYYVNGYITSTQVEENGNDFGDATFGAIYRIELDSEGNLIKDGDELKTGILAPKIVGTEKTNIFIFGDKIYYATPNIEKDSSGKVDYNLTEFYKSDINGKNRDRIYKTEVSSTDYQFAFYNVDNKVVLVVFDSTNLYMVDCESEEATLVAENVSDVAFLNEYEINSSNCLSQNIYYTRTAKNEEHTTQGNVLCYASLTEKQEVELKRNATYKVIDQKDDYVVFTKQATNDESACYYMLRYFDPVNTLIRLSYQAFDNAVMVLDFENGNYRGMITTNSSGYLMHIKPMQNNSPDFEVINSETELTLLAVYGDEVFAYNSDNELYKVNYKTKAVVKLSNKDDTTLDFSIKTDYDGQYVYVYQKLTGEAGTDGESKTGIYLARINTLDSEHKVETLANVLEEHKKSEE